MATPETAGAAAEVALAAPVTRVTLLEDRAQVVREGTVELDPGPRRLRLADVTPLVADRTLLVRAGDGARVDDARAEREWRIGRDEDPPDLVEVAARLEEEQRELRYRDELMGALGQRQELVERALALQVKAVGRELPWAPGGLEEGWTAGVERLLEELRSLDARELEETAAIEELRERISALERRRGYVPPARRELRSSLLIDLTVEAAGPRCLEVRYVVPCAQWRPIHRATLEGEAVRFEHEGAVWQATGEDWTDVALAFSTARSTQRSEPPLLADDVLRARPRGEKMVDVELREEAIQTTGEGVAQRAQPEGLPGVDDGGETRLLEAAARVSIPCDGRLQRVPITTFEAAAEVDRVCRPELAGQVHLRSRQANGAAHPLLAGPVDLMRGSGYVGRGEVPFVGPGERFALGWGSEDALRVEREEEEERAAARLTGKQTIVRTVTLYLSNLDDRPARFAVEERIPVSEIAKVTVEVDAKATRPAAAADAQGIVRWDVELPPHGTKELKLVYRLVASSDVRGL